MLKIGPYKACHGLVLAPLAGISDSSFRSLCKSCGAELVFSEMAAAEGIRRKMGRTLSYLSFGESERPLGIQIFGSNQGSLVEAARIVEEQYRPDIIDINLGCPVRKVTRTGAGAALLKETRKLAQIVSAVVKSVRVPVSAKMRLGWNDDRSGDIARILEDCGIRFLTVHARRAVDGYGVKAKWDVFANIMQATAIPVIANGDVFCPEDAAYLLKEVGVPAVMVGRGALGRPWIFSQMLQFLADGRYEADPLPKERLGFLLRQMEAMKEQRSEGKTAGRIKKHIPYYFRGMPERKRQVQELLGLKKYEEIAGTLKGIIEAHE